MVVITWDYLKAAVLVEWKKEKSCINNFCSNSEVRQRYWGCSLSLIWTEGRGGANVWGDSAEVWPSGGQDGWRQSSAAQLTKGRLQDAGSTNSTVSRLSGRPSLRWWKESTQNGQVGGPAQSSKNPSWGGVARVISGTRKTPCPPWLSDFRKDSVFLTSPSKPSEFSALDTQSNLPDKVPMPQI